ncbi:MAG TPA: glycoside hydrolase family 15 protein [Candidatus Saccharimonadales bacterium]|nr:glycoside hydrolase family 15 protein [Candidatus Saccharimonadales bacterium]
MGRPVVLSNGHILVGLDKYATVHDFYFPYVGLENLTTARGLNHKIGVWVDGAFSWLDDDSWDIKIDFEENALVSNITAENAKLGVKLGFKDFVDCRYPAFCRIITVNNTSSHPSEIRLFMHQAFVISRAGRSDTAMYIPEGHYLLDYKGWSSLLIYACQAGGEPFDQFAVGNYGSEDKEGTFRDAEDGELSCSLVEHGGVDTVIRLKMNIEGGQAKTVHYWVVASDSQFDAEAIHHVLLKKGLDYRLDSTRQAYASWLAIAGPRLEKIDPKYKSLAKKSLMMVKAHTDRHGGIIASSDSSIYNYGKDYYCYVWPRDGAYAILPLIELGYKDEPKRFFEFCADTMHPRGHMMHKYQPDRAVGSTWHPQVNQNHPELPIQEDETAIIIYALSRYLEVSGDEDFIRRLYAHFIKPTCDFMARFIDPATSLPHASYDLWEERFATHSYSVFVTQSALRRAADIAQKFSDPESAEKWRAAAGRIDDGLMLLFNANGAYFRRNVLLKADGNLAFDDTLDSASAFGALMFLPEPLKDERVIGTFQAIERRLLNSSPSGGAPRYERDNYFLTKKRYLGNPWIITTLWMAQYYIKAGQADKARAIMDWVCQRAGPSGMLSEQVDPESGVPVSVDPLVWSHSTFVETALMLSENPN